MTRPLRRILPVLLVTAVLVGGWAAARSGTVALDLYRAARYGEAAQALAEPGTEAEPGTSLLRACLEPAPAAALAALEEAVGAGGAVAGEARVETAAIRFGQGRYREVARLLATLDEGVGAPSGRALVLAGLALRAAGDLPGAERMLATVKPGDPGFAAARTALGDLALADKDAAKALRYYDTAGDDSRAGAGRWQALRLSGRDEDAEHLRKRLEETAPGSVAVLEINRLLRAEADEVEARQAQGAAPRDTIRTAATPAQGRYTLQLGAYSDRGLALELVRRFADEVPELRIDTVRDNHGQLLYKVRSGSYVNPATARSEADRLKRRLGVDVFVAESGE